MGRKGLGLESLVYRYIWPMKAALERIPGSVPLCAVECECGHLKRLSERALRDCGECSWKQEGTYARNTQIFNLSIFCSAHNKKRTLTNFYHVEIKIVRWFLALLSTVVVF